MKTKSLSTLTILLLILIGCHSKSSVKESNESPTNPYVGEWESRKAENLGNGTYGTRYFELGQNDWEIKFTLYVDSTLSMPVFQFRGVGKYQVQGKSTVVQDAANALFGFDQKFITLLTDNQDLINNFGFAACNLEMNIEKDITADGCSFLVSKNVCAKEYDLLKLADGMLYFGARPAEGDMCTEANRPTTLFYPLAKVIK